MWRSARTGGQGPGLHRQRAFDGLDLDLEDDEAEASPRRARLQRTNILPAIIAGALALCGLVAAFILLVPNSPFRTRPPIDPATMVPQVAPNTLVPIAPEKALALNAERPFDVKGPVEPALPFRFTGGEAARARAVACLGATAYYEAGDDMDGARSVIQVVLNRARHPAFPASVCGVVFQGSERRTGCQFTFTCDGAMRRIPSAAAWSRAMAVANMMLSGGVDTRVGTATHYHTDWVLPYWAASLSKLAKVKTHIFYTWRGNWGKRPAFSRKLSGAEPVIGALGSLSPAHFDPNQDVAATTVDLPQVESTVSLPPAGVGDRSLRGAVVYGADSGDDRFFIGVDGGTFPGNHAVAALALCKGKAQCHVYGWRDPQYRAGAAPLSDAQANELTFYFVRDAKGGERALWNCAQVKRANSAQCLPDDAVGRAALLR